MYPCEMKYKLPCGTGKMPVPQRVNFLLGSVLWASGNRQDACSTKSEFSSGKFLVGFWEQARCLFHKE